VEAVILRDDPDDLVFISQADQDDELLKPGGWTNEPGKTQGAQQYLAAGFMVPLVHWSTPIGGVRTLVLTMQDAPTEEQLASEEPDPDVYGLLYWGWPGCVETLEIDWINGTCLVLPSGAGSITAVYPDQGGDPWDMRVGAMVAPDLRPAMGGLSVARRTRRVAELAGLASSDRIDLPLRAHAVSLMLLDGLYGAVEVKFSRSSARGTGTAGNFGASIVPGDATPIVIPNGTRSIVCTNLSGAALTPSLVFTLAL
jgi:hypothetical protein